MRRLVAVAALLLLGGCRPVPAPIASPTPASPTPSVLPSVLPTAAVPAAMLNPAVTQATIGQTICVAGWTATIRPPASYTTALKVRQLAAMHAADQNPADYEEDHDIPLELGGSPRDPSNLWPQPWPQARVKDAEENRLHAAVCAASVTLDAARAEIYKDWPPR